MKKKKSQGVKRMQELGYRSVVVQFPRAAYRDVKRAAGRQGVKIATWVRHHAARAALEILKKGGKP